MATKEFVYTELLLFCVGIDVQQQKFDCRKDRKVGRCCRLSINQEWQLKFPSLQSFFLRFVSKLIYYDKTIISSKKTFTDGRTERSIEIVGSFIESHQNWNGN